ncbi:internalin B precursor [Clostridium ragsdalei P11]|uniref:Internalin B n=1 Tax=Clostridium ragsdalei P11 TaxID=1353534 RepID=A0A1A6AIC5_9CLOT|nr:leucine-rich repeat domain-containing protein [Clostridium ragsdalei]OBR89825.1 internalin B precursor [Clostridium ragsdalei P11]
MICNKCNKKIPDSSNFCPNCGSKVMNKKIHNKKLLISSITIIVLLIGIVGGYQYYKNHFTTQTNNKSNEVSKQVQNTSDKDKVIMFKDSGFDEFIREKINKPQGAIHKSDVDYLTHLEIEGHEGAEADISGIEDMTNLQDLTISFGKIKNIDKLKELTNLKTLHLEGLELTDISWLKELKNLETLFLDGNKISDISVLKNLSKLESLSLKDNNITDISTLKKLPNLKEVYLNTNRVNNVNTLKGGVPKLESFSIERNKFTDVNQLITAFKGTKIKSIDLDFNVGISDADIKKLQDAIPACTIQYNVRDSEYYKTN